MKHIVLPFIICVMLSEMLSFHEFVLKKDYYVVTYPSSSLFPPLVKQSGESLSEILHEKVQNNEISSNPTHILEKVKGGTLLIQRLNDLLKHGGFCLITTSLPVTCNLKNCKHPPSGVKADVFVITESSSPMVLTFSDSSPESDLLAYNKSVAKALTFARFFTNEAFDILYGVVTSTDTASKESFASRLTELRKATSVYSIPSNLVMSNSRCEAIFEAVITCSALTGVAPTDSGTENCLFVLTKKMYTKVMNSINGPWENIDSVVDYNDKYFTAMLKERFSRAGRTVETMEKQTAVSQRNGEGEGEVKETEKSNVMNGDCSLIWHYVTTRQDSDKESVDLCDLVVYNYGFSDTSEAGRDVTIVGTDMGNKCVKRVTWSIPGLSNPGKSKVESVSVVGKPWGITRISSGKVLVSLPHERKLSVLSHQPTLVLRRTMNTKRNYFGIASQDSETIIACAPYESSLDIIDLRDSGVRHIKSRQDETLINKPKFVCTTTSDGVIVSDGCTNAVGKLLAAGSVRCSKKTVCPRGVTVDRNGDVFFADAAAAKKGIVKITKDGHQEDISATNDGPSKPSGLCFDDYGRLFVTNKDRIYVLHSATD